MKHDIRRQIAKRLGGALDLGHAGQEGEQRAGMSAQCAADRGRHLRLDPSAGVAAVIVDRQQKAFSFALDLGRVAEQSREPRGVERRRHCEDAQIRAQFGGGVERQGQRQIAVEAALMDLVEQQCSDPRKFGIGLDPREEHAVGHRDDSRRLTDLAVEPCLVAKRCARRLAPLERHIFGRRAGREPSRDQQQH